jgi:hypothetical protein
MAMTAWAAKFVTSAICLSVNGRTFLTKDAHEAYQLVVLEHRHDQQGADAADSHAGHRDGIVLKISLIDCVVGDVLGLPRSNKTAPGMAWTWPVSRALQVFGEFLWQAKLCGHLHGAVFDPEQGAESGVADASGVPNDCVKHRLKVAGRRADDLENLRSG